ncbi:MAG: hypothetical protein N2559_15610 [Anaerolineae bacterium]|nr:hypothetical protein [Anaerolineae bacterium]
MVHLGFIYVLAFLSYPLSKYDRWTRWLDLALALLGVLAIAYALVDLDTFIRRSTLPDPPDLFFGLAAIVLLIELSCRVVGNTFTIVLIIVLLYIFFGPYFPGPIAHKGYDVDRLVGHMFMTLKAPCSLLKREGQGERRLIKIISAEHPILCQYSMLLWERMVWFVL